MNGTFGPAENPLHLFDHSPAAMAISDAGGTVVRVNDALCELLGHTRDELAGSAHAELFVSAERRDVTSEALDVRGGSRPFAQGTRRLLHADGHQLDLLVTLAPVADEQDERRFVLTHLHEPARSAGYGRRKRHVAVVEDAGSDTMEQFRIHAGREATLAALGRRVLGGMELDRLMGEVAGTVAAALCVDHAAVFELRPGGTTMRLRAAVGWDDDQLGTTLLGVPGQLPSGTVPTGPVTLDELLGDERAAVVAQQGIFAGAIALIGGAGEATGVLAAYATRPHEFARGDLEYLQALADLLAAAIEHRTLDEQRRRLFDATMAASVQERATLASALHEGPVQNLAVLTLRLEQARMNLASGRLDATERLLIQLQESMAAEITGLRRLMRELRPPVLDELGLSEAMREQVRLFQRDTAMDATFESTLAAERLRPDLEVLLYKVTQESLAGVARRASAERVRIALHAAAERIELRIAGDGPADGDELGGLRQQVEQAGGRWELTSAPGGGTTLGVSFDQAGA
jgi:PAS domain S-box-containing protein